MSIDELKAEALLLSVAARAELARALISSLDDLSEEEVEALWVEEALRRAAELESGAVKAIPAGEVMAQLRARFK